MSAKPWWEPIEMENGEAARFLVGALELWVENRPLEWRVSARYGSDPLDPRATREQPLPPDHPAGSSIARFASGEDADRLDMRITLADRAVVFRPDEPFHVLSDDEAVIYVSSPVWIALYDRPDRLLTEVPTWRPTDTWFGPSPREGELCFASRTAAKLDQTALVVRRHRAITRITLQNDGAVPLRVERVKVPVPHLDLYTDAALDMWTSPVRVVREKDGDTRVRIESIDKPTLLSRARVPRDNRIERALTWFLG